MSKKIYFENEQGKVEMFLGGTGPVRVTALSGLGNPEKKYNTVTFAGKNGQKTLSSVKNPRTIVISGDIRSKDRSLPEKMLKILDRPGTLTLDFGDKKRKIFCNQVDISEGTRYGSYMNFVLTLTADDVYFTDIQMTETALFIRLDMLSGDIVFPCMFTKKITEAEVENRGEENSEPVIYIYNFNNDVNENAGGILIENQTTGQKIKLETGMEENEVITIDITNRKIESSDRGNITHLISNDTFLNRFWLAPGINRLKAEHGNTGEEISVICKHYSNYREGIY